MEIVPGYSNYCLIVLCRKFKRILPLHQIYFLSLWTIKLHISEFLKPQL